MTALVAKRDKVLAMAIEQAVRRGDALDGLSSRKSDYGPGGPQSGTRTNTKSFSSHRGEKRVGNRSEGEGRERGNFNGGNGNAKRNMQRKVRKSTRAP